MVLKYLLMGHHLIPGVSGMSGRLCNLLGRGDFQPAARSGSRGPSPGSVLLAATVSCISLSTAVYTGKGHGWSRRDDKRDTKHRLEQGIDALMAMDALLGLRDPWN